MLKNMTKTQKIMAIVLVAVIVGTIIFVFYKRSQKSKIEEASEKKEIDDDKHQNNGVSTDEIQYRVIKKEMHDKPKQEKVTSPPPPQETDEVKQGTTKVKDKK